MARCRNVSTYAWGKQGIAGGGHDGDCHDGDCHRGEEGEKPCNWQDTPPLIKLPRRVLTWREADLLPPHGVIDRRRNRRGLGIDHSWEAISPSAAVTVRWPSVPP
jgi:hypothetical protein